MRPSSRSARRTVRPGTWPPPRSPSRRPSRSSPTATTRRRAWAGRCWTGTVSARCSLAWRARAVRWRWCGARGKRGDWRRARGELPRTGGDDRSPAEAIIYLAQADVAEGERERAVAALEKTLAATKVSKAEVRTALAMLAWQDKALDKAG